MYECGRYSGNKERGTAQAVPFVNYRKNYSFLSSSPSLARRRHRAAAWASASSIAFLASAAFLARASARFSFFSSRTFSLPSSSRNALSAPSPLFQRGADDARVAAVAIAETRADRVEQLHHGFVGHQIRGSQAARGEVSALAERDHLLDDAASRPWPWEQSSRCALPRSPK